MSQRSIPAALAILALFAGCGDSAEDARRELEESGVEFTAKAFARKAREGDIRSVELFLAAGMDPNEKKEDGSTALFTLVGMSESDLEVVKLLERELVGIRTNHVTEQSPLTE